ncbi:MAG: DUF2339 domain-containing protein [Myxococcota bacterium]
MVGDWNTHNTPPDPDPHPDQDLDLKPPRESPIWPLTIAGGAALLLGLVFFGWHVLEQGWVEASHKLVLGGVTSALLTAAAWPLAKRGQTEVAGAIGGAGLGAWFSTWLFARHVYGFVSAGEAFVALVAAVLVCLLLADRLRLRLMAALAGVAACVTPVVTSNGDGQLPELMLYQLGVLAAFALLDVRRNWPELPTLGLLGTWALLMGWGASNLDATTSVAFVACAGVLVVAGAASTWRVAMQAADAHDQRLAVARVVIGGLAAWSVCGWAFVEHLPSLRMTTFMLAAWHLGFAVFIARRSEMLHRATLALGWVMACVGGLLLGGMMAMVGWWAMMLVSMGLVWSGRQRDLGLVLAPALCAGGYVLVFASLPWALGAGIVTALMLVVIALWSGPQRAPIGALVVLGMLLHGAVVTATGPASMSTCFMLGLLPFGVVVVRAALAPVTGFVTAFRALVVALAASVVVVANADAAGGEVLGLAALAVSGGALLARARPQHGRSGAYALMGLVTAGFAALLALDVLVTAMPMHASLLLTLVLAAVGLGLVVAGLRLGHKMWRSVGLTAIMLGAAKLALFDTAHAALPVRGLSFITVGAILILGAFAYRRAARRDEGLAC